MVLWFASLQCRGRTWHLLFMARIDQSLRGWTRRVCYVAGVRALCELYGTYSNSLVTPAVRLINFFSSRIVKALPMSRSFGTNQLAHNSTTFASTAACYVVTLKNTVYTVVKLGFFFVLVVCLVV